MLFRALLLLFAAIVVSLLLAYSFTKNRKHLAWAIWFIKIGIGMAVLFGIFYVVERLILI